MTEILNELSETVYIADTETYELLFLNAAGRHFLDVNDSYEGKKCYEVLQHRTEPCPFCTNTKLSAASVYEWDFFNPVSHRYYLLKDKLIQWNTTKLARMEIALDITEIREKQIELEKVAQMEHFIQNSLRLLHRPQSLRENVQDLLEAVGLFLQAERSYIFDINFESASTSNTYEWCAEGFHSEINNLQNVPLSAIQRWIPFFQRNEYVYIENIDDIKNMVPEEYEILSTQGIKSLVAVPLLTEKNELLGYIGVDNPSLKIAPGSIDVICRTLAYFLVSVFTKYKIEKELKDMSFKDQLTGLQNRNKFSHDTAIIQEHYSHNVGIAYMDMNGLKVINDTFGHEKGNEALRSIAGRLLTLFRKNNLYRIGGDEFVIICPDIPRNTFEQKITELQDYAKWENPYPISVGHLWFETISNIIEHLKAADSLMYQNKKQYYMIHPKCVIQ